MSSHSVSHRHPSSPGYRNLEPSSSAPTPSLFKKHLLRTFLTRLFSSLSMCQAHLPAAICPNTTSLDFFWNVNTLSFFSVYFIWVSGWISLSTMAAKLTLWELNFITFTPTDSHPGAQILVTEGTKWGMWMDESHVSTGVSLLAQHQRICLQGRRRCFHPWVGKMPWRKKWLPTLVFFPKPSHGQNSPGRLQSMGSQRIGHDWVTEHAHINKHLLWPYEPALGCKVVAKYIYTWRNNSDNNPQRLGLGMP